MRDYSPQALAALVPHPAPDAHKYSRGLAVVVAGSERYPGAACLASRASQLAGAGYTHAYVAPESVSLVRGFAPSLVVSPWGHWDDGEELQASTDDRPVAYLVGSGLVAGDSLTTALLQQILKEAQAPLVIDGGALGALCGFGFQPLCAQRAGLFPTIITPHAGEAAALAKSLDIAEEKPENLSRKLADAYKAICVLKGSTTYISDGDNVYPMTQGTAALAKAGTGDVLAGILCGFVAQGMDALDAAVLASLVHARAGVAAAQQVGDVSVCAEDVLVHISTALKSF